jgi:hypothetical protein
LAGGPIRACCARGRAHSGCIEQKDGYIARTSVKLKREIIMKKLSLLVTAITGLVLLAVATPVSGAEQPDGKEIKVKGEAKCAMCMLKEGDKCQTVIQSEKNGKTVTYYLADNEAAKSFHEDVCHSAKKVTATGTVKKVNGKQELSVTKIALVK